MDHQYKRTLWTKIKSFLIECKRVLKITKKPSQEEFKTIVKMSALGMLIIGVIGFVIQIIATIIK